MTKTKLEQTDIVLLEADVRNQIFQISRPNVTLVGDLAALYAEEPKQLKDRLGTTSSGG